MGLAEQIQGAGDNAVCPSPFFVATRQIIQMADFLRVDKVFCRRHLPTYLLQDEKGRVWGEP